MQNRIKILISFITLLLITAFGVSCNHLNSSTNSEISEAQPNKTTEYPVNFDLEIIIPDIIVSNISLNDLLNKNKIITYSLSENRQSIFLRTELDWFRFDIKTSILSVLPKTYVPNERALVPVEIKFKDIDESKNDNTKSTSSLSPDREKILFWSTTIFQSDGTLIPTSTPDPDPIAIENYQITSKTEIFFIDKIVEEPIFIGEIEGFVKNVRWIANNQKAILEMMPYAENYIWLIDLTDYSLTPLVTKEDVQSSNKFGILDISTNGNKILFQYYDQVRTASILSLEAKEIDTFTDFPPNLGAWWLPDGKRLILYSFNMPEDYSLTIYNLDSKMIERTLLTLDENSSIELIQRTNEEMYFVISSSTGQYNLILIKIDN